MIQVKTTGCWMLKQYCSGVLPVCTSTFMFRMDSVNLQDLTSLFVVVAHVVNIFSTSGANSMLIRHEFVGMRPAQWNCYPHIHHLFTIRINDSSQFITVFSPSNCHNFGIFPEFPHVSPKKAQSLSLLFCFLGCSCFLLFLGFRARRHLSTQHAAVARTTGGFHPDPNNMS